MTLALVNSLHGRMAFRIFWNSRKSPCAFSQLLNSIDKSRRKLTPRIRTHLYGFFGSMTGISIANEHRSKAPEF